jgi:hypothetical protein
MLRDTETLRFSVESFLLYLSARFSTLNTYQYLVFCESSVAQSRKSLQR